MQKDLKNNKNTKAFSHVKRSNNNSNKIIFNIGILLLLFVDYLFVEQISPCAFIICHRSNLGSEVKQRMVSSYFKNLS